MSAPIGCRSSSPFAEPQPWEGTYDFIGESRYLPGPRGLPLLKPPFGSMRRDRHEHRRPPLADSGRAWRAMSALQQLGIREQLGLPTRSWALITKTVMIVVQIGLFQRAALRAGATRRISRSATISIRIYGSMTRPLAKCWRRSIAGQRDRRADDLHGRRQAVHRLSGRWWPAGGGTDRGVAVIVFEIPRAI